MKIFAELFYGTVRATVVYLLVMVLIHITYIGTVTSAKLRGSPVVSSWWTESHVPSVSKTSQSHAFVRRFVPLFLHGIIIYNDWTFMQLKQTRVYPAWPYVKQGRTRNFRISYVLWAQTPPQPLQRNYTFPLDDYGFDGGEEPSSTPQLEGSESQSDVSTPSLVARLQKAHGLTKKKIYGAKPVRQPFFREERVRDHHHRAPPLAISSSAPLASRGTTVSNQDPRATSRSRIDRRRVINNGFQGNTTEPYFYPRRQSPWSRRGSRLSSPEADTTLSSPASISTYSTMSPVPIHRDLDYLSSTVSSPISPSADDIYSTEPDFTGMNTLMPLDSGVGLVDPSWLQSQYLISQISPSSPSVDGEVTPTPLSLLPRPATFPLSTVPCGAGWTVSTHLEPLSAGSPTSPLSAAPIDDGDRPFVFNAEYEAVTAARMEAVLQSNSTFLYPLQSTSKYKPSQSETPIPQRNFYFPTTPCSTPSSSPPSSRSNVTYGDSASCCEPRQQNAQTSPPTNKNAAYQLGSSSSLTGWAGWIPVEVSIVESVSLELLLCFLWSFRRGRRLQLCHCDGIGLWGRLLTYLRNILCILRARDFVESMNSLASNYPGASIYFWHW
jgi:hypothetical protein